MKQKEITSITRLGKTLIILLIVLICAISFGGLYVADKNSTKNLVPDYKLGMDLYGSRNIVIKVSDEANAEATEGNAESDTSAEETVEENDEPSQEDYLKTKKIIEQRLDYIKVADYKISLNQDNGTISLEVPENTNTDYVAQYCITPGVFAIKDNSTGEILMNNSDIKESKVAYYRETSGTTVYLTIQFNAEGTKKLNEISKEYVQSEDEEGNDTSKKVDMTLDDETILSSYFSEEVTNGMLQISLGTAVDSETLQTYLMQASNIAIFLNTDPMPIKYEMEVNRFVFSDVKLGSDMLVIIVCAVITVIAIIYMIIKYKKVTLLEIISLLGFMGILLIAIRLGNVELTISGLVAIAIMSIVEAVIISIMQKEYDNNDEGTIGKSMIELLKRVVVIFVPIIAISIIFAYSTYTMLASIGMIMFWSIIIMALYNILVLGMIIFKPIK